MLQWPANNRCDNQRPCKRSRFSLRDDFQICQIEAFMFSLSAEQMSVAASVLMEQYIRRSAILTTPHAADIAAFKATCLVAKSMAARPGDDPSYGQTSRDDQVAASTPSYCCDHWEFVHCQFPFIREGSTADADVDVSWVPCTTRKMKLMVVLSNCILDLPSTLDASCCSYYSCRFHAFSCAKFSWNLCGA